MHNIHCKLTVMTIPIPFGLSYVSSIPIPEFQENQIPERNWPLLCRCMKSALACSLYIRIIVSAYVGPRCMSCTPAISVGIDAAMYWHDYYYC